MEFKDNEQRERVEEVVKEVELLFKGNGGCLASALLNTAFLEDINGHDRLLVLEHFKK